MENLPPITDFRIVKKNSVSLSRYFDSISRNLTNNWIFLKGEIYDDLDTFKILNKVICLALPLEINKENVVISVGKLFIGLTDNEIISLKITVPTQKEKLINDYKFILYSFHYHLLKRNKYYNEFQHYFNFGGPNDENWLKDDLRDERTVKYLSEEDNEIYFFQKGKSVKTLNKELIFFTPNNIAISLSIMKRSYKKIQKLHKTLFNLSEQKIIKLEKKDKSLIYEYIEEVTTCIIFSYTAVESFVNSAIPEDFFYEKLNEKNILEKWSKENIERWMSTSNKLTLILPKIFNNEEDIKKQEFWNNFKNLENVRNSLIHQKTIHEGTKLNTDIYEDLLKNDIFKTIKSSLEVIEYYYKFDNSHPYFPLGFGIASFQLKKIQNFKSHFEKLEML